MLFKSVLNRPSVLISGDMLDEVTAIVDGYNAYFSFSKVKTGYSGERIFKNVLSFYSA